MIPSDGSISDRMPRHRQFPKKRDVTCDGVY
jgi:hypothetical protein